MTLINYLSLLFGTWGRPKTETQRGFNLGRPCGIQLGFINSFNFTGSNHHSLPLTLLFDLEATLYLKLIKCFQFSHIYEYVFVCMYMCIWASHMVLMVKNLPANAEDIRETSSILGSGRSSGGGYGNPLQYFCLQNPMNRGVGWAKVHRLTRLGHDWGT